MAYRSFFLLIRVMASCTAFSMACTWGLMPWPLEALAAGLLAADAFRSSCLSASILARTINSVISIGMGVTIEGG